MQKLFRSLEEGCISKHLSSCLMPFLLKQSSVWAKIPQDFLKMLYGSFWPVFLKIFYFLRIFLSTLCGISEVVFFRVHTFTCESVRRSKAESIQIPAAPADLPRDIWFQWASCDCQTFPFCVVLFFLRLTRQKEIQLSWNLISLLRPWVSGFNPWTSAGILSPSLHAVSETAQNLAQCRVSWSWQTEADLPFPGHLFIVSIHQDLFHGRSFALDSQVLAQTQALLFILLFSCDALHPLL